MFKEFSGMLTSLKEILLEALVEASASHYTQSPCSRLRPGQVKKH